MLFTDESGFYLLPSTVATYAPRGQTPVLEHTLTRDHLSVIGAITPDGRLYTACQEKAFTSRDVCRFLDHLLGQISGKLIVVWDGASIHRSKVIRQYLSEGAAGRLHLEQLPGYSPELNPMEGVWHHLKDEELANVCCLDKAHLKAEFILARERFRHKRHLIRACFTHAGCQ